ncbi:MAG: GvpL/GvpF family gas vesicle protein [Planctomycetes bacterium]|nr:GvpL/GvpF family gas vesicle protein [Planctomycetota bacterium]
MARKGTNGKNGGVAALPGKPRKAKAAAKAAPAKAAAAKAAPVKAPVKAAARGAAKAAPVKAPPVKAAAAAKAPAPKSRARAVAPAEPAEPALAAAPARAARASRSQVGVVRGGDKSGKYVYCIIAAAEPMRFGHIGIGVEPAEVHTVNYKEIAAVVSDTPVEVYDPTRENVLAHERVNELVMRDHTVIPMAFGTVFKTREDIVELLRSAYQAFKDVLVKMQGKLEFGLKVLWDPETVIRELEKDDESIRRLKKEISSQKGSTYFARMQYGRLVDGQLQERSERYVTEIANHLRGVSVASRSNKVIGDRMIMNFAFLVPREQEAAFDAKVKEIGARLDHLTFKYTGPWPPYNFVNIRLKLERAKS